MDGHGPGWMMVVPLGLMTAILGAIGGVVGVTLLGVVAATGVLPTDLSLTVGTTAAFGTTAAVKGAVAVSVVGFAAAAFGTFRSEATGETDRSAPVADD